MSFLIKHQKQTRKQTQQREQTRDKKTNNLAALAGRSAESLGITTSCDGYWRKVWLTFMHVTSPLNLTPAYPDREKQTKEQHKTNEKDETNDKKQISRNVLAQLNLSSLQLA